MFVYGPRLLVALITFGIGVGAGRLFGSERKPCGQRVYSRAPVMSAPIVVAAPSLDAPPRPMPRTACELSFTDHFIPGKAISRPAPVFPPAAQAAGVQGRVVVRVSLDESGSVVKAEVRSGPELLRKAAEDAARLVRVSPTYLSGRPTRATGWAKYTFRLD